MPKLDPLDRDLESDAVFDVKVGMFNKWVCAPKHMSREEVQANMDTFSGTRAGWQVMEPDANDDPTLTNPGRCDEDENRQHWNCNC